MPNAVAIRDSKDPAGPASSSAPRPPGSSSPPSNTDTTASDQQRHGDGAPRLVAV
ncbi:hypothetical protein ABZ806_02205 [Spirillospora sp. NPDC047418]